VTGAPSRDCRLRAAKNAAGDDFAGTLEKRSEAVVATQPPDFNSLTLASP